MNDAMRVLQLKVPLFIRYSVVYQNVQSSTGSTLMLLLSGGEKIRARAEGAIIFNTPSDLFSEVVAEFKIG